MSIILRAISIFIRTLQDEQLRVLFQHFDSASLRRLRKRILQVEGYGSGGIGLGKEITALIDCMGKEVTEGVVIDGGAHEGNYASEFLRQAPHARIYCFEPNPVSFMKLSEKFRDDFRVTAVPAGLAGEASRRNLYFDSPGSSLSSLVKRDLKHFGIEFSDYVEVELVRLSDYCQKSALAPQALKLDIEGFEMPVIADALENLPSLRVIAFEFGGANLDSRSTFRDFFNLFDLHRWKVLRLTAGGLVWVQSYSEFDEIYVKCDFVAISAHS